MKSTTLSDSISLVFNQNQTNVTDLTIKDFLNFLIEELSLHSIREYLPAMEGESFFLLAATGLGKTITVPVQCLLNILSQSNFESNVIDYNNKNSKGRVYVIVPTITIAEEQSEFLNSLYNKFCISNSILSEDLFGSRTGNMSFNTNSPIQFLTTGVFEAMSSNNSFYPGFDSILIDEAHKTLETGVNFEIQLTHCLYNGVRVDYMSATVKTDDLKDALKVTNLIKADKIRHPIFKHNTKLNMVDSIIDVVKNTIVDPNFESAYFPKELVNSRNIVQELHTEWKNRGSALLVIVNGFKDIELLGKQIKSVYPDLQILEFSSAIKKNKVKFKEFKTTEQSLIFAKKRYIIIATNVVEMGVTFENLDFILTKNEELIKNDNGKIECVPLKVNSLYQRLGRVGRKNSGIGIITNDANSDYSMLEDTELNNLENEAINFPLKTKSLTLLSLYTLQYGLCSSNNEYDLLVLALQRFGNPSLTYNNSDKIYQILELRKVVQKLGLLNSDYTLNKRGENVQILVNYTNLSITSATNLLVAVENENWNDFCFWMLYDMIQTISLQDFGKTSPNSLNLDLDSKLPILQSCFKPKIATASLISNPVAPNTNKLFEVYDFVIRLLDLCSIQSEGFGTIANSDYNFFASEASDIGLSFDLLTNEFSKKTELRILQSIYNSALEVGKSILEGLKIVGISCDIPIFDYEKNGKKYVVNEINFKQRDPLMNYDVQSIQIQEKLTLTGNVKINSKLIDHNQLLASYYNIESTREVTFNLEFEWVNNDQSKTGYISALTYHNLIIDKFQKGDVFNAVIRTDKKQKQGGEVELNHNLVSLNFTKICEYEGIVKTSSETELAVNSKIEFANNLLAASLELKTSIEVHNVFNVSKIYFHFKEMYIYLHSNGKTSIEIYQFCVDISKIYEQMFQAKLETDYDVILNLDNPEEISHKNNLLENLIFGINQIKILIKTF